MRVLLSLAALLLLGSAATAQAQENRDNYQPRTLSQIIEQHRVIAANGTSGISLLFSADVFPSRVKVTYMGDKRAIPASRKEFIAEWAKTRKLDRGTVDLFEDELLFKEGPTEYWLPVQKQVVPFFAEELKNGDVVELYLMWIGSRTENGATDWVFLVNEFKR